MQKGNLTSGMPGLHDDVLMYFKDDDNMVAGYLDDVDEDMKVCKQCGSKFLKKSRGWNATYCSFDCQLEHNKKMTAMRYRKKVGKEE